MMIANRCEKLWAANNTRSSDSWFLKILIIGTRCVTVTWKKKVLSFFLCVKFYLILIIYIIISVGTLYSNNSKKTDISFLIWLYNLFNLS